MDALEAAILRTLLYADIFQYAMTPDELHRFLIHSEPVSRQQFHFTLENSPRLQALLCISDGYITLIHTGHYIPERIRREKIARKLLPLAGYYGRWLAQIPFVRMVALTGALAVRNPPHEHDDFDYMLVTQPGRVWLARAFAIVLVRLVRLRGIELCPNYVVAENNLLQQRQNLYIAHEVTQMIPLYGHDVYHRLRQINAWADTFLPNTAAQHTEEIQSGHGFIRHWLEWLLSGRTGDWLEAWEYRRKRARFQQEAQHPDAAAEIDSNNVKGHFHDHGHPILRQYTARLKEYGLEA